MKALIFGITGQDGSYLSELLLSKGYDVHGVIRRSSSFNTGRINHIYDKLHLHYGDLTDANCVNTIISSLQPDEIYNLAAQSHVKVSFEIPNYTAQVDAVGTLNILEAILHHCPKAKLYQASSSELFGGIKSSMPPEGYNENSLMQPQSPYACAKLFSYWLCKNYRSGYGLFVSNGILFNHESPRRGETFVTRKITRAATRIKVGLQDKLILGNLNAHRDWGFAGDYVEAMWRMLQDEISDDFVVATGQSYSIRYFAAKAFECLGLNWQDHVTVDSKYERPNEVDFLLGDASRAKEILDWQPRVDLDGLIKMMVDHDLKLAEKEKV